MAAAATDEWSSSLCDCSPLPSCLLSTFLPCMLLGQTTSRMRDPSMQSHSEFNSDCAIFCGIQCLTGCGCLYNMAKRGEIRSRYGIKGSGCDDCCVSYWCMCCAMIQQDKEVRARTAAPAVITQGYQGEKQGMSMPA